MKQRVPWPCLLALLLLPALVRAQEPPPADPTIPSLARAVAGDAGTAVERARRLAGWINTNLAWSSSDYQNRTPEQIVSRKAGNCADLARVLEAFFQAAGLRSRWVAEINIQPRSEGRQANASTKISAWGNRGSVFGLIHNDHRWLELYDDESESWIPVDPSVGVVGIHEWIAARMGPGTRPTSPVPEIAQISSQMIVPFVVVAMDSRRNEVVEDRSRHYLVDQFDREFGGALSKLPAWREWEASVTEVSAVAARALVGAVNLHEHSPLIERVAQAYGRLKQEYLRSLETAIR